MKKDAKNKNQSDFSIRGKLIEAKIIRMKSKKTAHVEIKTIKFIPKYERYLVKKSIFAVHIPDELNVNIGDTVLCGETRKLSKTKSMIIIKKIESIVPEKNKIDSIPIDTLQKIGDEKWSKLMQML